MRATVRKSTSSEVLIFLECTFKMASRPARSGSSTGTRLSKRPGLVRAGSRDSGRLVAARMMTPMFSSKPSISVRS